MTLEDSKKKAWFVDDGMETVRFHIEELKTLGYEVTEITSSAELAEKLCLQNWGGDVDKVDPPNLVFLDMMMPPPPELPLAKVDAGLATGAYLLAECRKLSPDVPVIILSNLTVQETMDAVWVHCRSWLPERPPDATPSDLAGIMKERLNLTVYEKRRTPPFMVPVLVERALRP